MFEINKPEYVNKTFRMPLELVKTMEAVAQENGVSLNNLVVQCCRYAINDLSESSNDGAVQNNKMD